MSIFQVKSLILYYPSALQQPSFWGGAIAKYGLDKFYIYIYEYFSYESKLISEKALTDLETSYIQKFDFETLYNFKMTATSLEGYQHGG